MDNVIEGTSSLLRTVLDSTAKKLVDAWETHDPQEKDFSEVISETLSNVQSPFTGLDTNFKQVSYIKKNFNYVNYRGADEQTYGLELLNFSVESL